MAATTTSTRRSLRAVTRRLPRAQRDRYLPLLDTVSDTSALRALLVLAHVHVDELSGAYFNGDATAVIHQRAALRLRAWRTSA
jgi:hypothetical protein